MARMRRTHYSGDISPDLEGKQVTVSGWVQEKRDLGGIRFLTLRDDLGKVQITAPKKKVSEELFELIDSVGREGVVTISGMVKTSQQAPGGAEIIPDSIEVLNEAQSPLPMDPSGRVDAELDTRLDFRFMDLRRPNTNLVFRVRSRFLDSIRSALISKGFVEVNTPKIIASATEGGTELFPISYFEREAFLAQSPQLYKEVLTSCFEKVFEVGPIFRAETHDTTRHLNEVTSIDIEEAFADQEDVMRLLEELVANSLALIKTEFGDSLAKFGMDVPMVKAPFKRMSYSDIIDLLGGGVAWGEDLSTPQLKQLSKKVNGAYFITEWPSRIKPFYIEREPENPDICQAFDLMFGDIELASGGTRVHNESTLRSNIEEKGLSPESFDYHLKAFRYGVPPHAGWGMGAERLMMAITGLKNIREVTLYPRDRHRLTP